MISTIFFDMDGVLFDTETEAARILQNECAPRFGCRFSDELLNRCTGRDYNGCRDLYLEEFGKAFPFAEVWEACASRLREEAENGTLPQKPGVRELLFLLQRKKIPCILVTSTESAQARFFLEKAKLLSFFQKIIGGESVSCGKPAPDIYLKAIKECDVQTQSITVIEDSIQGVQAALNAGLSVIMIPDRVQPDEALAKKCLAVVKSLDRVPSILKENGLWS